jgi:predicted nucleotidyltransferase
LDGTYEPQNDNAPKKTQRDYSAPRREALVAAPEKIILFGSAARGEMGPNSDVDLLVN